MDSFCHELPKIELHAHLTGSIRPDTLHEVWQDMRQEDSTLELDDPVKVLETARKTMDAKSFFPLFSKFIYNLVRGKEYITLCTRAVLADFAADGVTYLELRSIPRPSSSSVPTKDAYVDLILSIIDSQPAHQKPANTYLILSVDRKNTPEEALETIELAIKYRSRGVVGVDLAGNPANNAKQVAQLAVAYRRAKEAGLGVTLHFAEVEESSQEEELRALLMYKPDRLGHVIRVPDWAKEVIRERRLGLELCLTCNVSAKLTEGGYEGHHFGYWRDKGCPIAICTDDSGIFGTTVTNEWQQLTAAFHLSRSDAIAVCRSGIERIFGTEADKTRLHAALDEFGRKWKD